MQKSYSIIELWGMSWLNSKKLPEFNLFMLHSTTMRESFQMDKTVDKEETDEIFERSVKFFCFVFGDLKTQNNLSFGRRNRET